VFLLAAGLMWGIVGAGPDAAHSAPPMTRTEEGHDRDDHATRTATVTAYCARCSGSVGCRDNRLRVGDCAADPKWHPYGSRVWIQGFGELVVRDTGGAIKGRDRFDVYLGAPRRCACGDRVGRARRQWREVR
jgi:3D (Asp-Asp-Asp) domain-containing protein